MIKHKILIAILFATSATFANAELKINKVDAKGINSNIGSIAVKDSSYGLVLTPKLSNLPPGLHGFHIHENPSCDAQEKDGKMVAAQAAGEHFDPQRTNKHDEPWGDGHLGDLPPIYVDAAGNASQPVLAPRLKVADLAGHSIMIHAGADNHSDHPLPSGGGGERVACGVMK